MATRHLPKNLSRIVAWTVRTAVGLVILVVAMGIAVRLFETRPVPGQVDPDAVRPTVTVMTARALPVRRAWTGYGTVRAMSVADVPARIAATVVSIPEGIEDGATIAGGAVIARLDDEDFVARSAAAGQALAEFDAQAARLDVDERRLRDRLELVDERVGLADAEVRRVEDAAEQGAARPREVDVARSSLATVRSERAALLSQLESIPSSRASVAARRAAAASDLRLAELAVERSTIRNPLTGPGRFVLQSVDVEPGESVVPGQRVARVVDPARIEVPIRLPSAARRWIAAGDEASLRPAGEDGPPIESRIARIAPEDDAASRTVTVFVEVLQSPGDVAALAPGRFVRAEIRRTETGDHVVVPRRSLDGDRLLIVDADGIIRGRTARPRFAVHGSLPATGLPDEEWVVLEEPPAPGTQIVLVPTRRLLDGLAVLPADVRDRPEPAAAEAAP